MGVRNKNSTGYVHPDEPNLLNLHKAMQYNDSGEPELRTHVHGITLNTGDVIIDKVRVEVDGSHNTISADHPVPVYFPDTPTVTIQDGGNTITVDGSVSATVTGTVSLAQGTLDALENINATVSGTVTIQDGGNTITVDGNVGIDGPVEIKNDIDNPIPISKNLTVNSANNRIYVSQETDVILADSNYELNLARGLVDSQYVEMKNGYAPSLSTGSSTVWGLDTLYPWSAWTGTGSRLWVGSDNAADIGQTFYIDGLDSNFAKIHETVTLNGTTYVQTTATFYRVNRMYQMTGTTNAGNISVRVTSSTGTQVYYVLAGLGRGKTGIFTIPAGYTAYILYGDCSSYKNGSGNVSGQVDMYTRTYTGVTMPFMNQFAAVVANGQYRNEFNVPLRIPEKTDIDVRFLPSGNATTVSVNWEMILIPN